MTRAQAIDRSILERLQMEQTLLEKEEELEKGKEEITPVPVVVESLSTIEEMFKESYFITPDRIRLEMTRDSLAEIARAESLKIEIRKQIAPVDSLHASDTLYFKLKSELLKIEKDLDLATITLKQFGYKMFRNIPPEIPSYLPVVEDYLLGPGDELIIEISGQMNESWDRIINRDGKIVLPKVGQITLWGKTYKNAKITIEDALNNEFTNIEVNVTLGELRSINVFVLGEVKNPGLYNTITLSDPLSVLYSAGGLKKTGSLREIKHIPKKGKSTIFDLYNPLVEEKVLPRVKLETGDIIYVPPIGNVVGLTGAINRPGIYEIKGLNDLSNIIKMGGGMLPTGGTFRVQLERISSGERKIVTDFVFKNQQEFQTKIKEIKIKNGDLVEVFEIPPIRHEYVEIEGNIERPGTYGFEKGMTVIDLIEESGGLKEGTYLDRAELLRFRGVLTPEIIELNLSKINEGDENENIQLKEWDKLKIYSKDDILEKFTVTINGNVRFPGTYPLNPEMTVGDLIFKGIPLQSSKEEAEFFRINLEKGITIEALNITDSSNLNIPLQPMDHIFIKKKPDYQEVGYIYLLGEFVYPGTYPIKSGTPLKELIERAGGFTDEAYLEGAKFIRKSVADIQNEAIQKLIWEARLRLLSERRYEFTEVKSPEDISTQLRYLFGNQERLDKLSKMINPGRVVINLNDPKQLNIPLEDGDTLIIPRLPNTVQIIGHVYNPTSINYVDGLSLNDYLTMAGGPKKTADKKAIYIRRASGKVVKSSLEIKPGDTIIIPEKVIVGKGFWEIAGVAANILYQIAVAILAINTFAE
jgi:protein involved in polysaccharide export with SLBB domain